MAWAGASAWRHALLSGATFAVWFGVAFLVLAIAAQPWSPRHHRRREALLVGGDGGAEGSGS